jgi:hypothetical protein
VVHVLCVASLVIISVAIEEFKQEDLESAIAKVRVHTKPLCTYKAMWNSESNRIRSFSTLNLPLTPVLTDVKQVKHAALVYDRYHPSSVQLDAFETRCMPPHEFRNQVPTATHTYHLDIDLYMYMYLK